MPPFAKSPAQLETFYQEAMADFPQVALRKTFSCLCAYVNGHMANGLFTDFMKGYVIIPEAARADRTRLNSWIVRSIEHAGGLPPKIKKQKNVLKTSGTRQGLWRKSGDFDGLI